MTKTPTRVRVADLLPNQENPRTITQDKLQKLVESLRQFPQMLELRPLVVESLTHPVVLGGNMRLRALQQLGVEEVPVLTAEELTPEQRAEFVVKDNVGFGEWDWEALANGWDLDQLAAWGLDVPDLEEAVAADDGFDPTPEELEGADIVAGDLFEIGPHRLLCGDSLEAENLDRLLEGRRANLCLTDPPYNIGFNETYNPRHRFRRIANDHQDQDTFRQFCQTFLQRIRDHVDGCVYLFGPPGPDGRIMFTEADQHLHCSTTIVWRKDRFVLGRAKYQSQYENIWTGWTDDHEPVWFGWTTDGKQWHGDRKQTNVWEFDRPKRSDAHPTMKPIELLARAIQHASRPGDVVLDLFLGSGSTMVAAQQLGRKCYGVELEPTYCAVILRRLKLQNPNLKITKNGEPYDPETQAGEK
jgi:DNA modification methylase